jgi:hypothetical protein
MSCFTSFAPDARTAPRTRQETGRPVRLIRIGYALTVLASLAAFALRVSVTGGA